MKNCFSVKIFLFASLIFLFSNFYAFSQSESKTQSESKEDVVKIEDLSTTVKKEKQVVDKEAIPDYLEVQPSDEVALPNIEGELPDLEDKITSNKKGDESDSILYFEGNIGGGFPGLFTGDFNLSRSSNNNYFSLDFFHESNIGYGTKRSYDGFFDQDTELAIEGTINFTKKIDLEYAFDYGAQQFGLQSLSPKYYSTYLQEGTIFTRGNFSLTDNFSLFTDIEGGLSSWFASYIPSSEVQDTASTLFRLALTPRFGFKANAGIFDCTTSAEYNFNYANGIANLFDHRVELLYDMNLDFAPFTVSGNLGYIYAQEKSIVPFELRFNYEKDFEIELSGGLKSAPSNIFALQKEYLLYDDYDYQEQTDWFCEFWVRFPITEYVENKVTLEFAQTAFENGILVANYSSVDSTTGLYTVENFCGTRLNSEYQFDLIFPSSELSILWQAWWLDYPSAICPHVIVVDYSFSTLDSRYGFSVWAKMGFGGDRTILGDVLPDLGSSFFFRASDAFKFSIVLEDMIKLFTLSDRTLYGNYIKRSGSVSLFVSFYL